MWKGRAELQLTLVFPQPGPCPEPAHKDDCSTAPTLLKYNAWASDGHAGKLRLLLHGSETFRGLKEVLPRQLDGKGDLTLHFGPWCWADFGLGTRAEGAHGPAGPFANICQCRKHHLRWDIPAGAELISIN